MSSKRRVKSLIATILSAALIIGALPMTAAAADGVVYQTAVIGGKTADLVYVTMGKDRTADVALAGGSVHN